MAKKKRLSDKEIVKEVITNFGPVIDLRKTPNVIIEILRRHGGSVVADAPDGGVSVAGVGTPPGPATRNPTSLGNVVDNVQLMKEILKLSKQVAVLSERIGKVSGG
jgi:hypothetical protein